MTMAVGVPFRRWLGYALITVVLWGVWGAFTGISAAYGVPDTLVYCVWALTMIPPALVVLAQSKWKLDGAPRAIGYGLAVGLLGAGGQMILFYAVTRGPAYLVFPVISLSPVVTIAMSFLLLNERTGRLGVVGIALALMALPGFDFAPGAGAGEPAAGWLVPATVVMLCWGVQAYLMKAANRIMTAESIFVYMGLSGLLLVPVAIAMTDTASATTWSWRASGLVAAIQALNAIGALTLVFAFRYGKAIIVAPLANAAAPLATALISLAVLGVLPGAFKATAIALALVASVLLVIEPDAASDEAAA